MKQFVSGESDAKGLSVILPYIAFDPADVAIRRPELLGTLGIRPGSARQGTWAGYFRKNNKPTQPNGNNTLKRTYEPRRRFVLGLPQRS